MEERIKNAIEILQEEKEELEAKANGDWNILAQCCGIQRGIDMLEDLLLD